MEIDKAKFIVRTGEFHSTDELWDAAKALLDTMDWVSVETPPEKPGDYNVAVNSDDEIWVGSMRFDGKDWIHEGEPTYCHSWHCEVTHWKHLPEAPNED